MKKLIIGLLAAGCMGSMNTMASDRQVNIEITNLTNAIYFTPLLVSAHDARTHMFRVGTTASASLRHLMLPSARLQSLGLRILSLSRLPMRSLSLRPGGSLTPL